MKRIDLGQLTSLLRSCLSPRQLPHGRQLHQLLLKSGHAAASLYVSNCLLQMYTRCDPGLRDAHMLFEQMLERNCFSWNSMVDACLRSGDRPLALRLFQSMPEKNSFSWNTIVTGLVRYGDLANARRILDEMPIKDALAVNAVLHGCTRHGRVEESFHLFRSLGSETDWSLSPCNDKFVLTTVISACADETALNYGKQIHGRIVVGQIELDSFLGSSLVDMYAKCNDLDNASKIMSMMPETDEYSLSALISGYAMCGRLDEARLIFDRTEKPSLVLWNSIVTGYASSGQGRDALHLFIRMARCDIAPDLSTFASVLSACSSTVGQWHGKQIHASGIKHGVVDDIVVASALIDSYSKSGNWEDACRVFGEIKSYDTILLNSMINVYCNFGRIEDARRVFDMINKKSLISWNSMIVGYSQNGCSVEAMELFTKMHQLNLKLDNVSLASAISASASVCSLGIGSQFFALATTKGLVRDHIVVSSLVDLYCKCGKVSDGRKIFNSINYLDVALWNSMLMGYASNGYALEVLELFETMINSNINPTEVSFISVLTACCHCGFVEEGLKWFNKMKGEYGLNPVVEHYSCVVDMLVRSGRLGESIDFIDSMPFKPDVSMWTSVLGGCKAHGDEELGSKVAGKLIELNPDHSGPYLQLSSMYAAHGEWDCAAQVRQFMHHKRIIKSAGQSWVDI